MRHLPILLLLLTVGCASVRTNHGIPNFAWVDLRSHICRGGQPTKEGFEWLQWMGVTNDIKLNGGRDKTAMAIKQFHITTWQQVFGGKKMEKNIASASAAIADYTFIHCEHGVNRTGTVVLHYRLHHGWPKWAAQAEADKYGWQSSLPGLKAYVKKLEKNYR